MKIPCARFDRPGDQDGRLVASLDEASETVGIDLTTQIRSLYDYDGQLWATWNDEPTRSSYAHALTQAWHDAGGGQRTVHLLVVDEQYDYQEDVLDNVAESD